MNVILNKSYENIPLCEKEILRYAMCKEADEAVLSLLNECISEAEGAFSYRVCYRVLDARCDGAVCDLGLVSFKSEKLSETLCGCDRAIVFAATVGVGIDRLISRYTKVSPSKALMLQAVGAQQIEALCDKFCGDIEAEYGVALTHRFSPGYGDLSLEAQRDIFSLLDCERKIGLTLGESLVMSPTKSVTAIVGMR